jgi:hypothetical protein
LERADGAGDGAASRLPLLLVFVEERDDIVGDRIGRWLM